MAKGDVTPLTFTSEIDPVTHVRVVRLTPRDRIFHRNYFYQKCFLQGGTQLLIGGVDDGNWNYWLLDLQQHTLRQLTEGPGDNSFDGFITEDDRALIFMRHNRHIVRVELDTLREEVLYELPAQWVSTSAWAPDSTGSKMIGMSLSADTWIPLNDWNDFQRQYHLNPTTRCEVIDLASGHSKVLFEEPRWLGHPGFRPNDTNTIMYCHEGPHDLIRNRIWLYDRQTGLSAPVSQPEAETFTHEFWVPDGSRIIFVSLNKETHQRHICQTLAGSAQSEKVMEMPACSHLMSNYDGSLLVGDGCGTPVDLTDEGGYTALTDPWLYLFEQGQKQTRKITRHDTSWRVIDGQCQASHPHPSFSPDLSHVLYTSDRDGLPAVYLAEIAPLLKGSSK